MTLLTLFPIASFSRVILREAVPGERRGNMRVMTESDVAMDEAEFDHLLWGHLVQSQTATITIMSK
jgi:hypothetical protein